MDGPERPRLVRQVEDSDLDNLRNSVSGVLIFCTCLVCATAIFCAWILR